MGRTWRLLTIAVLVVALALVITGCLGPLPPVQAATWTSPALDGIVQSRPVMVGGVAVVATENDSLYGLALSDGHVVWGPVHIGTPASLAYVHSIDPMSAGCGDIDPLGITSNLVLDPGTGVVFAVGEVVPSPGAVPLHELVGVDAATGEVKVAPVSVDPRAMTHPALEQQRAGLAIGNGNIYVGFGGLAGDCGDYHGFVVAAKEDGSGIAGSYEVANDTPANHAGAVWGTSGPILDSSGNVYATTGNSFSWPDTGHDQSDGVVKLSAATALLDYFQPPSWRGDNSIDLDLGSTGPAFVGPYLFVLGKQRTAFLLDPSSPGGANHETARASLPDVCSAFGANGAIGSSIFVVCTTGVRQLVVGSGGSTLTAGWTSPIHAGGPVAIGADTVWAVDRGGQYLYGFAPSDGHVTYRAPLPLDSSQHFPTPAVSGRTLVIESRNHVVGFDF